MAKREFDVWLGKDEEGVDLDVKRHFASLYQDMLHHITEKGLASQQNRFRLAAYAVWWHTPKDLRVPKFQRDLAIQLGMIDDELFRKWRTQYAELFDQKATQSAAEKLVCEAMPDVIQASINCAIKDGPQGVQDRKLLMEIAGVIKGKAQVEVSGPDGGAIRIDIAYAEDDYGDAPEAAGVAAGSDADGQ